MAGSRDDSEIHDKKQDLPVKIRKKGSGDYSVVLGKIADNPVYSVRLTNPSGNVSKQAKYLSLASGVHPESYSAEPDLDVRQKAQAKCKLTNKDIIDGSTGEIREDIPEKFLEYAQAAALSEKVEEVDVYEILDGEKGESCDEPDYKSNEPLEEFIKSTDWEDKRYWTSKLIVERSKELDSIKKVGNCFSNLKEEYDIREERYQDWI